MYAQLQDVGAVGGKLYYGDKTIQHAGVVIGLGAHRTAGHTHYRQTVSYTHLDVYKRQSYMGAVWAMIQPVVTVEMYYIVFQVIMTQKATLVGEGIEVPYLVFLTAGLVPWFYFSEAIVNGMMALLEYE